MKTDIWMPLYIGDYLADTQHLTPEKHGIYLLLMMHYWKQGPLENDLEELCCVTRAREEKLVRVLDEFFSLENGVWKHGRLEKERARAQAKSEAAKASARKRWEKKGECQEDANAHANEDANAYANGDAESMLEGIRNGCSSQSQSHSQLESDNHLQKERGKRASRFTPPTVEDVQAYCQERNNRVDPVRFVNFYGAKGWMIGKNKMKNWKQAVITWESNDRDKKPDQYNMGVARVEGF